ncbi:MAG: Ig-like domain-containing protein [Chitinophagaceae bacterium]|nr:Ig-like domain-containing protein [Chitinophagaceae bacterium]
MRKFLPVLIVLLAFGAKAQTLVHYWNFNNSTTETALLTPSSSLVAGASIVHNSGANSGGFTSIIQITSNTGQGFDNTNPNARNGDAAGTHLRLNNPIGGNLVFSLPTTGFQNIMVKYATRRSGSGAHNQVIDYSLDGTTFTNLTTLQPVDGDPTLQTLNFSSISGANNNPNFKVRISFTQGGGGLEGNNRFDNFSLDGTSLADNQPPVPVFAPLNNAADVAISVQPTITFDRDIRLVDNTPVNNTNIDDVVELRLNNAAGAAVPFDATYSNRVITIVPTSTLQNNQMYYVALKANTVEGTNDVAVADLRTTTFTTIAIQTTFNPGDLLPVAYRMNTNNADDEVAFLTLVNILPGTKINFTDAKYTTNAQPQCAGGFTFTAPPAGIAAGTVIRINTSPLASTQGIVTGSDFGLSSNGDQVMVYTGTAAMPSHITALSSNGWVATNTSCSGSLSMRPASLTDGTNALNMSTHPNAVSGNVVNAYYNGPQDGTRAFLTTEILNPLNWVTAAGGTPAQEWPAYSFGGIPTVVSAAVVNQTTLRVIFSKDLDETSAANLANFTGIANLSSITRTNNGSLRDTLLLTYSTPFMQGSSYSLTINGVQSALGIPMAAPFVFNFSYNTTIAFRQNFVVTGENTGNLVVELTLTNPAPSSVQLVYKPTPWSTATLAGDVDMGSGTLTLNFTGASATTQTVTIPVLNDMVAELDEYVVLQLENPTGLAITGTSYATAFIKDDDRQAPMPTREIELEYLSSVKANNPAGSSAEVVAYDAATKRLFITSGIQSRLDIADFSNPAAVALVKSVDITPYGSTITSVATANGIVACAVPANDAMANGKVVLFNTNGDLLNQVTVGVLPDMVTFSPDGKKILTANEGQPNDSYTIDPEGSVSVIDISGGAAALTQANVTTLLFTAFNAQETALKAQGVRKTKSTSTLSQDFEPEYITVSADSKKAWVTIQENNAMAEINLETTAITKVWGLGVKDFNSSMTGIDVSDNNGQVLIANWPLKQAV